MAIAADAVADTTKLQTTLPGVTLLRDPDLKTTAAWGLRIADADAPFPGTFVVDGTGTVTWRRLGGSTGDWPTYAELTDALPR